VTLPSLGFERLLARHELDDRPTIASHGGTREVALPQSWAPIEISLSAVRR
jgi:hypothetical protein